MEMKQRKVQSGKHVEKDPKPQKNTPPKRSGQSTSSLLVNFLLWLAIFSAVLASSLYFIKLRIEPKPLKFVKQLKFEGDENMKQNVIDARIPVRFLDAVPNSSISRKNFTKDENSPFGSIELEVCSNSHQVYASYDSTKPFTLLDYIFSICPSSEKKKMSAFEFWKKSSKSHLYYEGQIYKDFKNVKDLLPSYLQANDLGDLSSNFIFASRGAQRQLHYSFGNTHLTVLDGSIELIIYPPTDANKLYFFPMSHPNAYFAQAYYPESIYSFKYFMDILSKFQNFPEAEGYKTRVSKGDVLYIPPFWSYQIQFSSPSVVLETHSSSYEGEVFAELLKIKVPDADHNDYRMFIIKKHIDHLIQTLFNTEPNQFIHDYVFARYHPLYSDLVLSTSTDFSGCEMEDTETEEQIQDQLKQFVQEMEYYGKELDKFEGVKKIVLESFLDVFLNTVVGVGDTYSFLTNCYNVGLVNAKSTAQDIE